MDSLSGDMKSLCEEISKGSGERKSGIQELKVRTETIRKNTGKFLENLAKCHAEMGGNQRKKLREEREALIRNVGALMEDARNRERATRTDLAEAKRTWKDMSEVLRSRRAKAPRGEGRGLRRGDAA